MDMCMYTCMYMCMYVCRCPFVLCLRVYTSAIPHPLPNPQTQTFFSLPDSVLEGPDPDAAIPPHTTAAAVPIAGEGKEGVPAAGQGPSLPEGEESFLGSQTL